MTEPTYNEKKFEELMLYVAAKCEQHVRFGATKLNKILFYADFISYVNRGVPITGAVYQRLDFGPAPVKLKPAEQKLIRSNAAILRASPIGAYTEKRLFALRAPDLAIFTAEEISLVDQVIDAFEHRSAVEVSDHSHRLPCWQLAKNGEQIPYFTALLPAHIGPLSEADARWAADAVARFERSAA